MKLWRGIVGGLVGAALGSLIYYWLIVAQGLRAPLLIPGLTGLGCGLAYGRRSWILGGYSAGLGVVANILLDWKLFFFTEHPGLGFFLRNIHRQAPIVVLGQNVSMPVVYLIGAVVAFWFGIGRRYNRSVPQAATANESAKEETDPETDTPDI